MNGRRRLHLGWKAVSGGPGLIVCLFFALIFPSLVLAQSGSGDGDNADGIDILIAGSENTTLNERVIGSLQSALADEVTIEPFSPAQGVRNPEALVISLGPVALGRVQRLEPRPPQLALLVSESQFAGYAGRSGHQSTAVYLNPPVLQQALLGRLILPQATRVAMLVRPGQEPQYDELAQMLERVDLSLKTFTVESSETLIPTLTRALDYGDFLLGTPDETLYNARTIKHILLTAYRRNRILVGPDRAFVQAGAIASAHTALPAVLQAGIRATQRWLESGELPAPAYPERFSVVVNSQVARSLNIVLPDKDQLESDLQRLAESLRLGGGYD